MKSYWKSFHVSDYVIPPPLPPRSSATQCSIKSLSGWLSTFVSSCVCCSGCSGVFYTYVGHTFLEHKWVNQHLRDSYSFWPLALACVSQKCGCGEAAWELVCWRNGREGQRRFVEEGTIVWGFCSVVQVQLWLKVSCDRSWQLWMVSLPGSGMYTHMWAHILCEEPGSTVILQ